MGPKLTEKDLPNFLLCRGKKSQAVTLFFKYQPFYDYFIYGFKLNEISHLNIFLLSRAAVSGGRL